MGIHDRDYYREDGNRWWGSAMEHRGTVFLIAVTVSCMAAFYLFAEQRVDVDADGQKTRVTIRVLEQYAPFQATHVLSGQVWRLVTSFFVTPFHFFSVVFGMLGLYWFGGEMEGLYGTRRFVVFYLLAGVLTNLVRLALVLLGVIADPPILSASAPLLAVFVLFAFHYPHRPVVWSIPAWVVVAIYVGLSALTLVTSTQAGQAWGVEPLAGAVIGFLYHRSGGRLFGLLDGTSSVYQRGAPRRRPLPNLRVYDEQDAPRPAAVSAAHTDDAPTPDAPEAKPAARGTVDEYLEAKMDAVLEKVARHGRGSLTAEENDILMRASEALKRRRG